MKSTARTKQPQDIRHWILGGALTLIAAFLCVALVYVNTHAYSGTTSTVTVGNATPSVDTIHINQVSSSSTTDATSISISPGTTSDVWINGTLSDGNGYGDITAIDAFLYRSAATCEVEGDINGNNCYHNDVSCDITDHSGNSATFTCHFALNYFADATDTGTYSAQHWIGKIIVRDSTDPAVGSSANATTTTEVNTTGALTFPDTIDFGSLTASEKTTTSNNKTTAISQAGTEVEDMKVSGTNLTCPTSSTSIPVGNLNWVITTNEAYDGADVTALSGTPSSQFLGIGLQTSDATVPSKDVYWNIFVPSDALGICTGTITMTSIAH